MAEESAYEDDVQVSRSEQWAERGWYGTFSDLVEGSHLGLDEQGRGRVR